MIAITPEQSTIVRSIFKTLAPDVEVWAFGSRVLGTAKPSSDLDLALYAKARIPLQTLGLIEAALEESPLPFRVDCVDTYEISREFRHIIEAQRERLV